MSTLEKPLSKKAFAELARSEAREKLLSNYLKETSTVYTILRTRSSSGMSRTISLLVSNGDGISDITYYAAQALGEKLIEANGHRAIRVQGGGMDMGFHLVYSLSSVLFSGEHRAGYVLSHRWL
jgi:hypothetical protein